MSEEKTKRESLPSRRFAVSGVLIVVLFSLMYWLYGGAGECSRGQALKTNITFTVAVIVLDAIRRAAMEWLLRRFKSMIGAVVIISGTSLILLLALIWEAPKFYYHDGYYLYPGTWLDMSCITVDDTYLVVMMVVCPAFGIASFAGDMWFVSQLKKTQPQ